MKASNSTQKAHYNKSNKTRHYNSMETKVIQQAEAAFRHKPYRIGAAEYIKTKQEEKQTEKHTVQVLLESGDSFTTAISGTEEEIMEYYIGNYFNTGTEEDNMQQVIDIVFLERD